MLPVSMDINIIGVGNEKGRFSVWKYLILIALFVCIFVPAVKSSKLKQDMSLMDTKLVSYSDGTTETVCGPSAEEDIWV